MYQISSLSKVWAAFEGGEDNLGATFYEPSSSTIPDGFFMLGSYCQPNNRPFFGWVLVAKDDNRSDDQETPPKLVKPIDYILVWSSSNNSSSKKKDSTRNGHGCIWFPVSPEGYRAVGYVVTTDPNKPSTEKVRCVHSDFTVQCEPDTWIWGPKSGDDEFHVYSSRPMDRGTRALGVCTGTFTITTPSKSSSEDVNNVIACLKNNNLLNFFSAMPNLNQIQALIKAYSPIIYLHPKETYLPSSVNWYFENGALLYERKESESEPDSEEEIIHPVRVEKNGSNLPRGGSNDGEYWLDLPLDKNEKERVKKGDLQSAEAYINVKPMLGSTFTDIVFWIFYPFNGPGTAKIDLIDIPLGRIGEHVGDWEHLTLRISNFNGVLYRMYFSQHSKGKWVEAPLLEYFHSGDGGGNKPVAYSARNGHPFYPKPGLVLQGIGDIGIGIRNDTAKSSMVMDTGSRYSVVSAGYLADINDDDDDAAIVAEPPWLDFSGEWGPKIKYELGKEVEKIEGILSDDLKSTFGKLVSILPNEIYGEEGPTGPKMKSSWFGDER